MFNKIEYVYAVYKEQSFTRAAEKLYISQPCLSAAIKKIENEIGMPLFERRYSSLRPTEIGMKYIKTAEKIMDAKRDFISEINDISNMESGSITVGGSNYVCSYIMPRIVSEFTRLYPKINISLQETSSVELEKKILNEEIDLLIDSFDEENEAYDCHVLLEEKILLAVSANSEVNKGLEKYRILPETIFEASVDFTSGKPVSISHFKEEKFILLKSGHNMYKHAGEVFKKENFTPSVSFRLDQLLTSYALAASGNGACFVTDTMFRYHRFKDDVCLYNVKGSGSRKMYVAQKKNRYTTQAMSKFISVAKSFFDTKNYRVY